MSNPAPSAHGTELPVERATSFDVAALFGRTQEMAEKERFLTTRSPWNSHKDLIGRPFVFTSEPMYRTFNTKYGSMEVAQMYVRTINMGTGTVNPSKLVNFSGAYILNQIRGSSATDLIGSYIFTVAPNPLWDELPSGGYPLGIARYIHGVDRPPEDEAIFEEPETDFVRQNGASAKASPAERKAVRESQAIIAQGPVSRGPGRPKGTSEKAMQARQDALATVPSGANIREAAATLASKKFPWEADD